MYLIFHWVQTDYFLFRYRDTQLNSDQLCSHGRANIVLASQERSAEGNQEISLSWAKKEEVKNESRGNQNILTALNESMRETRSQRKRDGWCRAGFPKVECAMIVKQTAVYNKIVNRQWINSILPILWIQIKMQSFYSLKNRCIIHVTVCYEI